MTKNLISKILRILLSIDIIASGLAFGMAEQLEVEQVLATMNNLGYPLYILGALGIGKLAIGIVLLLPGGFRLRSYAYFALFINMFLAVYSHFAAGEGLFGAMSALITLAFATATAWLDYSGSKEMHT